MAESRTTINRDTEAAPDDAAESAPESSGGSGGAQSVRPPGSVDAEAAATIDQLMSTAGVGEEGERRSRERTPFTGKVALVLIADGKIQPPALYKAVNISPGGLCLQSRGMVHTDQAGAVQMRKSDGQVVTVGVIIRHCRYVADGIHHIGIQFAGMPPKLYPSHFETSPGHSVLDQS